MAGEPASEGERCGRCGADASSGDGFVCPACGALLAAYRDPATVPVREAAPAAPPAPVPRATAVEPASESAEPAAAPADDPDAGEAETALPEATERQTMPVAPPAPAPEPSVPRPEPPPEHRPRGSPRERPALPPSRYEAPAPRPRRPGFVTTGTLEPVLLFGGIALLLGCVFVGFASLAGGRAIAALGFFLSIVGVLAITVAVLVALVRRESERR